MSEEEHTRLNDGDGLKIATQEDFGIRRDGEGELLPVMQRIPGTDKAIKVIPVAAGPREEFAAVLEGRSTDEEQVAELWNEHIIEGIGSDITPEELRDEIPYGLVAGINQALKNSSGEDVFSAVQEQQAEVVKKQAAMIESVTEANPEIVDAVKDSVAEQGQK